MLGYSVGLLLGGGPSVSTIQGRNDKEGASRRRKQIQRGRVTVVVATLAALVGLEAAAAAVIVGLLLD